MGNNISNSSEDTIGFRNTNIDNYSNKLPIECEISQDVEKVIDNLPQQTQPTTPPNTQDQQINQMIDNMTGGGMDISEESLGLGNIFHKLEKNETIDNEISETSPFISSEMYNFLMKGGAKKTKKNKKQSGGDTTSMTEDSTEVKEKKDKKEESEDEQEDSDDELNYMSSSAHTLENKQTMEPTEQKEISSVNTSDINLITE